MRSIVAVFCPECMAEPGEPCFDDGGTKYVEPHRARLELLSSYVTRAEELYEAQDGPSGTAPLAYRKEGAE